MSDVFPTSEQNEPLPPELEYTTTGDYELLSHDATDIHQDRSRWNRILMPNICSCNELSDDARSHEFASSSHSKCEEIRFQAIDYESHSSVTRSPSPVLMMGEAEEMALDELNQSDPFACSTQISREFQRECEDTKIDFEIGRDKRRRMKSNDSSDLPCRKIGPPEIHMHKRHSSSGDVLTDSRQIAFGPLWLNGNGSVTDLTPGTVAEGDNFVTPVLFLSHPNLTEVDSKTTSPVESFPVKHSFVNKKFNHSQRSQARTIGPIANLDERIRLRRNIFHQRSRSSPEKGSYKHTSESPCGRNSYLAAESPNRKKEESDYLYTEREGLHTSVPDIPRKLSLEISNLSNSASVAEMKSALKRVRSKRITAENRNSNGPLRLSRQSPETAADLISYDDIRNRSDSTYSLQPMEDLRTRSGGSMRLRRAKSFFMKQKPIDIGKVRDFDSVSQTGSPDKNRFRKQKSLNENHLHRNRTLGHGDGETYQFDEDSLHGVTDAEVTALATTNTTFNILMQGDLHRRRRLTWTKTWAVLTTDRLLTLYKSKKDFEAARQEDWKKRSFRVKRRQTFSGSSALSGILSIVNLAGGCEIENVEQGKKGTAFQLMPHSYHTFTFAGDSATLPLDAEWRRTHKPIHLLCKNNEEFLYWVKSLVKLNSGDKFGRRGSRRDLLINTPADSTLSLQSQPAFTNQNYLATGYQFGGESSTTSGTSRHRVLDWSASSPALRRSTSAYDTRVMSLQSEYSGDISDVAGTKSSKGLDLNEIKFIDEEDDRDSVRTVRTIGRHTNRSPNSSFMPKQASIPENITTDMVSRPLSSEKLEARRREIEILRMKVLSNAEKRKAAANRTGNHISKHNLQAKPVHQKISKQDGLLNLPYQGSPHKESSSLFAEENPEQYHRNEDRDLVNKTNREPFERRGFMRDKVRERKKKSIAHRTHDEEQPVVPQSLGKNDTPVAYQSDSSDTSHSDCEEVGKDNIIVASFSKSEILGKNSSKAEEGSSATTLSNQSSANARESDGVTVHQPENLSLPRNEKESSITHLHSRFVGRKQKSLRQKVLRKLGKQAILSNSSPDINAAVEDEDHNTNSAPVSDDTEVKLKRHEAFRGHRRPSSPAVLIRCQSDSDLLYDSSSSEDDISIKDSMRTFELSEETFLETYGVIPRRKKKGKDASPFKRHSTYSLKNAFLDFTLQSNESSNTTLSNRRRRLSGSDGASSSSSVGEASQSSSEPGEKVDVQKQPLGKSKSDGANDAVVLRKPRRTVSDDGGSTLTVKNKEARNSWIASLTPNFGKKSNKDSPTRDASKVSRKIVFNTPASRLTSASHKGFLDWRNKKKQWERLWCVLQDSCLYMYNSPQSTSTEDAVVLRGYSVVANVKNLNRNRFPFRLERQGSPTIHLSADSDRDYMLWVGTLEKETSLVLPGSTDNEVLISSIKNTIRQTSSESPLKMREQDSKSKSLDKAPTREEFQQQKEHLLREVLANTQKVVDEQRLLQEKHSNSPMPLSVSPQATKISKNLLNEKFQRVREEEEMRTTKQLTLLNKRRNSAQLKLDQMTKQLAPKSGRRRRENPHRFAEMEAILREMQEKLDEVDKEIAERQALRQDTMEKIKQRLDLELQILEQRDTIDIIRKHIALQNSPASSPLSHRQDGSEKLPSIDEMAPSDCSSASSNSLSSSLSPESRNATPTPSKYLDTNSPQRTTLEDTTSNKGNNISNDRSLSDYSSISSSTDELDGQRKSSNEVKSYKTEQIRSKDEVDPSILADIEDFQRFSRQKLASLANHRS